MTIHYDWKKLNWKKPCEELAREVCCSPFTIYKKGRKLGKKLSRPCPAPQRVPWVHEVDWNEPDVSLARIIGVTRERIRQIRKGLGLPSSRTIIKARRFKVDMTNADWKLSNVKLGKIYGLHNTTVGYYRRRIAPHTLRKNLKPILRTLDWRLSFKILIKQLKDQHNLTIKGQSLSRYKDMIAPHLIKRRERLVYD